MYYYKCPILWMTTLKLRNSEIILRIRNTFMMSIIILTTMIILLMIGVAFYSIIIILELGFPVCEGTPIL